MDMGTRCLGESMGCSGIALGSHVSSDLRDLGPAMDKCSSTGECQYCSVSLAASVVPVEFDELICDMCKFQPTLEVPLVLRKRPNNNYPRNIT